MKNLISYVLYFFISAAFLINAWFLIAEFCGWLKRGTVKSRLVLLLLLAATFAAAQFSCRGLAPRGGYDNDHDFNYLSMSFFNPGTAGMVMSVKEASPLIFSSLGDLASGFSLSAVPARNKLLMFLSAVLLFACLRRLGLGFTASFFGFALYYFNFLALLNGNTFSTTPANMMLLFSALFATANFENRRRDFKGLLWALAAFFLVWTGRYELAFLPAVLLLFSLLRPDGALRGLLARPGGRGGAWVLLGAAAVLCAAWGVRLIANLQYNGPAPREAVLLAGHLRYQLIEGNLGVLLPRAAALIPYLAAGALVLTFLGAWFSTRRAERLILWMATLLWALFFSSIFILQDQYPLQFMRHRLYFFVPFVFLFASAAETCSARLAGRIFRPAGWALLACFCVLYLGANAKAARALEPEKRTNDHEWALLLDAQRNWPVGCMLVLPEYDRHHRRDLVKKYFPLLGGDCFGKTPECVIKYLPAYRQIFSDSGAVSGYGPGSPSYAPPGSRVFREALFTHKFYTTFNSETREEPPVRTGFYYAEGPRDKAWLLDREAVCAIKCGSYGEAEAGLREALKLDPTCAICAVNLEASLVFAGKEPSLRSASGGDLAMLTDVLASAAAGDDVRAKTGLQAFIARNREGDCLTMAYAYRTALEVKSGRGQRK